MPHARRILVVDDNMDQVQTMALIFRDMGHEVRFAVNGASALREARGFTPEVASPVEDSNVGGLEIPARGP